CVGYAETRRQFGRPLGNFQAVQQMMAILAGEAVAAGIGARFAASRLGRPDFGLAVAAAKIRCGQAAAHGIRISHQVYGAIGFTREH
ncbi:acyl-CoA dehydrogenase family protein, partial [Acinetobacter baumannii]